MKNGAFNEYAKVPNLFFWFPSTYCYFKLCERRHVNDAHSFLTALDLGLHNFKPVWLIERLALLQCQEVCGPENNKRKREKEIYIVWSLVERDRFCLLL